MKKSKIFFYADSFGLGHITREIALIRALDQTKFDITVFVSKHFDIVRGSLPGISVEETTIGLDVIPKGIGLDVPKTKLANLNLSETFSEKVAREKVRFETQRPDLIVADIPGEVFLAAEPLGIPVIAVSNFGWTIILEHLFGRSSPQYLLYADAYSKAAQTFVLPFDEPMQPFAKKKPVGLLRRRLLHPLPKKIEILTTFGRSGVPSAENRDQSPMHTIPPSAIESQDFVAASAAVFTKPAYGIVSEAVSAGVPLFFRTRPDFPESDYILKKMDWYGLVPDTLTPVDFITRELSNVNWELIEKMKKKYAKNSDVEITEAISSFF